MSSTRRSKSGELRQDSFSSSEELLDGSINALLAAKRIALIESQEVRELLWFIQWRSLGRGGLHQFCRELGARFPERIGTPMFRKLQHTRGRALKPAEVDALQNERLADGLKSPFWEVGIESGVDEFLGRESHEIHPLPRIENVETMVRSAVETLPEKLIRFCVDPKADIRRGVWFFDDLYGAIEQLRAELIREAQTRLADTAISRQINKALGFCFRRRRMVFIEGVAGIGRTETLRAWCDSHAGLVRYVEIPSSNDDRSFYAVFAEALGVARGTSYNGQQIKLRVEETLKASGLMLALDEAQYCWPQYQRPQSLPLRMLWIKTAFDFGTPFAVVAHSDFTRFQRVYVSKTLWSDEQWERRLNRRIILPAQHSEEDMMKIAKAKFPEGDAASWELLVGYALSSVKKQASAITEALESARDRAEQAGRTVPNFADIEAAVELDHLPSEHVYSAPQAPARVGTVESVHAGCSGDAGSMPKPISSHRSRTLKVHRAPAPAVASNQLGISAET